MPELAKDLQTGFVVWANDESIYVCVLMLTLSVSGKARRIYPISRTSLFVDHMERLPTAVDQEERVKNTRWPSTS